MSRANKGASASADRAGGPSGLSQSALSQPKALIPCASCGREIDNPFDIPNQPSGGIEFTTPGHYGSTAFDPMDGSAIAINLCDPCLTHLAKLKAVGIYRGGKFKVWNGK